MSNWERNVRQVVPYTPGEQPQEQNIIKLNTNENPYPPAPAVQEALQNLSPDALRKYPDPAAGKLVKALAERCQVDPAQVFVGVGSDDVLAMAFQTFFNSEKPVLFPDITYSFYDVWADAFRIPYQKIPLTDTFEICADDYQIPNGGIIFPNPNAPTGIAMAPESVERILQANPDVVVIVDEAYVDFGAETVLPLVEKYENLLVVQTYSKSRSMAGARIGFAVGSKKLISYLQAFKYSFNSYTMSDAAIALGTAALADEAYFQETCRKIVETREAAKKRFAELGFSFGDSRANFIFVTHAHVPAKQIFTALRARHIYVRYFDKPRIDNYLRITIGTPEEMEALYAALEEILQAEV
ncbi:MAG: histidinol-phosphate transaminase [Eubacterium sp.]|nr:histidinol-phosphate transaminase [Eubacterium sp.]